MVNEYEIKKQICDIGKRIYDKGMVAANDGNISVKINDNEFLCTPTGVSKGFMTPDYICRVDKNGNVLEANGSFKPSSEIKMHMRVYQHRPDVQSVVHAHPIYATSFAIAGVPLTQPIMPEAVIALGCVPIAEYGTPSTEEIPNAVAKYLQSFDAVLLENHIQALPVHAVVLVCAWEVVFDDGRFRVNLVYKLMGRRLDGSAVTLFGAVIRLQQILFVIFGRCQSDFKAASIFITPQIFGGIIHE